MKQLKTTPKTPKKATIKILHGLCGEPYKLPYLAGQTVEVEPSLAVELINKKLAEPVTAARETATLKKKATPPTGLKATKKK